jgi:hypothetical protein
MRTILATAAVLALIAVHAFGQTTPTSPSASSTLSTRQSSFATSPNAPCYSSTNPTSPCYSGTGYPSYSATAPNPPTASEGASPNAAGVETSAHIFTADQAKSRIEAKGYANVSRPQKAADGRWHSKALKDGKPVNVTLDPQNNVTEN